MPGEALLMPHNASDKAQVVGFGNVIQKARPSRNPHTSMYTYQDTPRYSAKHVKSSFPVMITFRTAPNLSN